MQDPAAKPVPQAQAAPPKPEVPPVKKPRPPALPGILFDSDMGADIDAVLALALLYGSASKVQVAAVTVSNSNLQAAAFCDAMGRFYAGGSRDLKKSQYYSPVGLPEEGRRLADAPVLSKPLALKASDGQPSFLTDVRTLEDTGDVAIVVRNALMEEKDGEAVIVMAGPATNMIRVLALQGNKEIVAAKVKLLVVAAGAYPDGPPDPRITADAVAARRLFAEWPSPIVAVGREVGTLLPFPGSRIATDLAWVPQHPVVEAYKAFRPMPYDAQSQAVAAALYGVDAATGAHEPSFETSAPGTIVVGRDGRTSFSPSPSGRDRYVIVNPARKKELVEAFAALVATKPAGFASNAAQPAQKAQ